MKTLFEPRDRAVLLDRLDRLVPAAKPRWGKMDCGQMLAHLCDAMRMSLGELEVEASAPAILSWPPVRHAIIHWFPFPKGAPTAKELVTRPADGHEEEVAALRALIERAAANEHGLWPPHPAFGRLSTRTWGVLMHKHIDHHLQQFRV